MAPWCWQDLCSSTKRKQNVAYQVAASMGIVAKVSKHSSTPLYEGSSGSRTNFNRTTILKMGLHFNFRWKNIPRNPYHIVSVCCYCEHTDTSKNCTLLLESNTYRILDRLERGFMFTINIVHEIKSTYGKTFPAEGVYQWENPFHLPIVCVCVCVME